MEGLKSLGINFQSIIFYIINIGLFALILWYLLYEPIIKTLEKRQKKIINTIDEANQIKSEFEKKYAEIKKEQLDAQHKLQEEAKNMEKFLDEKKQKMLLELEEEKQQMLAKVNEEIKVKKENITKDVEKHILELMKKIILEVVHNKVPQEVITESVSDAWSKYNK